MSGRNRRTHYNYGMGKLVEQLAHEELLRQAAAQLELAQLAMRESEREQARARVLAAQELIDEARRRGDQLRLRM